MKLLITGISWPPETFLIRLLLGLRDNGIEVCLSLSVPRSVKQAKKLGFQAICVGSRFSTPVGLFGSLIILGIRAMTHSPTRAWELARNALLKPTWYARIVSLQRLWGCYTQHWDVIYYPWVANAVEYLPVTRLGVPMVVSCRGRQVNVMPNRPDKAGLAEGLKLVFEAASAIHCVSDNMMEEAKALGLNPGKACVIRPAVNPEEFCPCRFRPIFRSQKRRLITVGSLSWVKGYEYLLIAIRLLCDRGFPIELAIIGDGVDRDRIIFTIEDLQLGGTVQLLGKLSPDRVLSELQNSDIFVFGSLSEGLPNAVLEAMACGLPVVTTDVGGVLEAVNHGVEGFVVSARDSEGMAAHIERLLVDQDLAESMGRAGRLRIERDFRLDQQVRSFAEMLVGAVLSNKEDPRRGSVG